MKGLLVDDDADIAELLQDELADANIQLDWEENGQSGLDRALAETYDFLILDMVIPGRTGLEICKEIRKTDENIPIIMLTGKDRESDKVTLLELGADEYITKPFSLAEVRARLKAILRRTSRNTSAPETKDEGVIKVQDLTIDTSRWKIFRGEEEILVTAHEFEILNILASQVDKPVTRERMVELIYGSYIEGYDQNINASINRIRNKIEEDSANPKYVKTMRGVGYMLAS